MNTYTVGRCSFTLHQDVNLTACPRFPEPTARFVNGICKHCFHWKTESKGILELINCSQNDLFGILKSNYRPPGLFFCSHNQLLAGSKTGRFEQNKGLVGMDV